MLQFHHEPDAIKASEALAARLEHDLVNGQHVLWLVSGGSNIALSVHIMDTVASKVEDKLINLTVALTDERYGLPGHQDSNWQQLRDAGFKPRGARIILTLIPGLTFEDTASAYEQSLGKALATADSVIAQLGMGSDGHISGILPGSVAVKNQGLVVAYDGGLYKRVTTTAMAFDQIDTAYCFAYGDDKRQAIDRLMNQELSVSEQPAQLLKTIAHAYLYTDQLEVKQQSVRNQLRSK